MILEIQKRLLIAIDGPAGAGKSTLSKKLASALDYTYLDTGAIYRSIALAAEKKAYDIQNEQALERLCQTSSIVLKHEFGKSIVLLDGMDVSDEIRTPEISLLSSYISAKPIVRRSLLEMQRRLGRNGGMVAEGRDMGTVVFPDADVKFYLDASPKERALRRYRELEKKDPSIDYEQVYREMLKRDADDSMRPVAPLSKASDAVYIDSTGKSVEEVLAFMINKIKEKATTER